MKPGKHQRSKQMSPDLCWKAHDPAHLLFCAHTLCMNYVIAMFLLVSWKNTRITTYCILSGFVHGQPPKIANKNIQQRTLPGFITISLY